MTRRQELFVKDILDNMERAESFVKGMTYRDFSKDVKNLFRHSGLFASANPPECGDPSAPADPPRRRIQRLCRFLMQTETT